MNATNARARTRYLNTIGADQVGAAGKEWIESFNPDIGEAWAEAPRSGHADGMPNPFVLR